MQHSIETHSLTRRFGQHVSVDGIDLRVPQGKIYGFLGANGAGKTTTIRMLLDLISPHQGSISILGRSLSKEREAILKQVGSLVESPSYYGHLSAYMNLKILTELMDLPERNISEVLETVRLTSHAKQKVKGFSLGMKQRLGIAQALLRKPKLLILDEPINGLDPAGIQEIRHLLRLLASEQGITVFLSSHILSEIEAISDYVGIIHQGRLIFQDSITTLQEMSRSQLVVVVDRLDEAYALLHKRGADVVQQDGKLFITITEQMNQAEAFRLLQPFSVLQVSEHSTSLEDIFLRLTGKGASL